MDVVYFIKQDLENDSEELRYSLRSLKNIPHAKVVIVGEKPEWATNVLHISVAQDGEKNQNVSRSLWHAVRSQEISEDFLMMNDDFFIMKPIPMMPTVNLGQMANVIHEYERRYPSGSDYINKMKSLYEVLTIAGNAHPISYELHMPMIINKSNVRHIEKVANGAVYQFRSYYGNYFTIGGTAVEDVKVYIADRQNPPLYRQNPKKYLSDQTILSTTGGSFKRGLPGNFIRNAFPEKSSYEI